MKKEKKTLQEKPRFKTWYNGYKSKEDFEKIDPISLTVPNETYSLKDIVEKFSREYPKHLLRTGYYDDIDENDPDFDDYDETRSPDFDYADAYELKQKINEKSKPRKQVIKETLKEPQPIENQPKEV